MDDDNLCQICLESYNTLNKLPKALDCCKLSFCLSCLKDIYKKNNDKLICPICRKLNNKNPTDLKIDKEKLEPCLICPTCRKGVIQRDLKIQITQDGISIIVCSKCSADYLSHSLSDYLDNVTEEMNFFISQFQNLKTETIEDHLMAQINQCVDNVISHVITRIKTKFKSKILKEISDKFGLDASSINNFGNNFTQFKENYESLLKLNKANIKNKDYPVIKSYVDYYINNSDVVRKNGMKLKKMQENINNYSSVISFNKMLVDYEDVENILEKFFEFNIGDVNLNKNKLFETNLQTGVKFIDERIFQLKKENDILYENFLKRDLQIKKLEREIVEITNRMNNDEVDRNKNKFPHCNQCMNTHAINNVNIDLNDVEFKIINSNEFINNKKNLLLQNFNFLIAANRFNNNNTQIINYTKNIENKNTVRMDDIEKKLFSFDFND